MNKRQTNEQNAQCYAQQEQLTSLGARRVMSIRIDHIYIYICIS